MKKVLHLKNKREKKIPKTLRQVKVDAFEKIITKRLHFWNNGFRYKTSGSLYNILRACQPGDYTIAGYSHHDPMILRIAKLYPYEAVRMTWKEVNQKVINNLRNSS